MFSEDFDNLTVGDLSTDLTGNTPGQNNWYVDTSDAEVVVTPESNKGNVVAIGEIHSAKNGGRGRLRQKNIEVLWNNRTNGNNILQLKYDFFVSDVFPENIEALVTLYFKNRLLHLNISSTTFNMPNSVQRTATTNGFGVVGTDSGGISLGNTTDPGLHNNFPFDTWISVELFLDYNLRKCYIYIPSMGILASDDFYLSSDQVPEILSIQGGNRNHSFNRGVKFDNIKLSALSSLPSYLGADDFITSKFNVFPNPATAVVTITNNENIGIEEITVYDTAGKIVKEQHCENESEVQLNIENLNSGTYFLHIVTDQGTGIKKLVKK